MYLIFGGECYYASGGGNDYLGQRETLNEAIHFAASLIGKRGVFNESEVDSVELTIEWTHVFSVAEGKVLSKFGDDPYGYGGPVLKILD